MNRRDFLKTAGGAAGGTAALAASGSATAAEGGGSGGHPDYGGWLGDVGNYSGKTVDKRGQKEVKISVGAKGNGGNFAFDPPAVWVDPGTKVTWEWTGKGGAHNVVGENADFQSGSPTAKAGNTFSQTFDEGGKVVQYYCHPHRSLGMKGAIAVGDVPTVAPSGSGGPITDPEKMGVPFQAHYVGFAAVFAVAISLEFTFYLLKYGESSHTKGGTN